MRRWVLRSVVEVVVEMALEMILVEPPALYLYEKVA